MSLEQLAKILNAALAGLSPLEQALLLAKESRDGFGGEWLIEAKPCGSFIVRRKEDK